MSKSLERTIHSLVNVLGSVAGKIINIGAHPRLGIERLVVASIVPILTTSILWYARTTVEVSDPEQLQWVQLWILQQKEAIHRVRHLVLLSSSSLLGRRDRYDYDSRRNGDDDEDERADRFAPPKLICLPARGVSAWAWYGFWPVSISSVEANVSRNDRSYGFAGPAGFKVTVWFAPLGADVAKNLLLQGRKLWLTKRAQKTEIWLNKSGHSPPCFDIATKKSRPLESVIIEHGIKDSLLADTKRFLQSEEWYSTKGIPYRRGYLLYGPPGCGKTSLITALAGSLRLPIVLVALGSKSMGDDGLLSALSGAPRDSIVLIEDVDCAFRKEDANERIMGYSRAVTLSGLLNAIDGVAAQEGRLIFLTTNYKERLTEALIRPGRVDAQYYIGNASKDGAGELFDQFFPPSRGIDGQKVKSARDDFIAEVETNVHTFAKLQGVLMQARDDPALAAKGMRQLFSEEVSSNFEPTALKGLKESRVSHIERGDDSIQSRIAMLEHAATCEDCTSKNCKGAKKVINHTKTCEKKPKSACKTCTFLIQLGVVHARKCSLEGGCPVPFCDRIRQQELREETAFVESLFEHGAPTEEQPAPATERTAESVKETGEEKKTS